MKPYKVSWQAGRLVLRNSEEISTVSVSCTSRLGSKATFEKLTVLISNREEWITIG